VFHGWEYFHGVESLLFEVLWNVSRQLPDTFENKFSNFELLGVRCGSIGRERLDNLKQKIEKCPEVGFRMMFVGGPKEIT